MEKSELEESLGGFSLGVKSLLVTYHPVTLENSTAEKQILNLFAALDEFPEYKLIFTFPNSDTDGRIIIERIKEYVQKNSNRSVAFPSLGLKRYLSALKYVSAAVGNSSSGIIEVPSFGIPTLNIGDRQKGRIAAKSVVNCGTGEDEILAGLRKILSSNYSCKGVANPYEGKNTAEKIVKILQTYPLEGLINKEFYDLS